MSFLFFFHISLQYRSALLFFNTGYMLCWKLASINKFDIQKHCEIHVNVRYRYLLNILDVGVWFSFWSRYDFLDIYFFWLHHIKPQFWSSRSSLLLICERIVLATMWLYQTWLNGIFWLHKDLSDLNAEFESFSDARGGASF